MWEEGTISSRSWATVGWFLMQYRYRTEPHEKIHPNRWWAMMSQVKNLENKGLDGEEIYHIMEGTEESGKILLGVTWQN